MIDQNYRGDGPPKDQNYSNRFYVGQQPLYDRFIDDDELDSDQP